MRIAIMIFTAIVVLAALNFSIYKKQQLKNHGEVILLELAPVDPRSLMQGDYMRLRYAIEGSASANTIPPHQKRGYMVIVPDEQNVAQFVRFYNGEDLKAEEKLQHFHKEYSSIRIVPDSFLFQEGHAEYYEEAKYGVFKFDNAGNHLLVGLADEHRNVITPKDNP